MPIPVQITFRDFPGSEALRANIENHAAKLERFSHAVLGCHVVLERSERHRKGNHYSMHVHLRVPGRDIQAGRGPVAEDRGAEDPYVVVRDTFDAARRQLEDYERTRRHDVKTHHPPLHVGRVAQIYKDAGYGILRTPDGREVHFHRHSLPEGHFDDLTMGAEVRFSDVPGEQGPWASTVYVVGKHHPLE